MPGLFNVGEFVLNIIHCSIKSWTIEEVGVSKKRDSGEFEVRSAFLEGLQKVRLHRVKSPGDVPSERVGLYGVLKKWTRGDVKEI